MAIRILAALPGVLLLVSALQWLLVPETAAQGLGSELQDGIGRSTQIGDTGAFFLSTSAMILLGAARQQAHWLYAGALLVGSAAFYRVVAWLAHGAAFATAFIAVELVMCGVLLFTARKIGTMS